MLKVVMKSRVDDLDKHPQAVILGGILDLTTITNTAQRMWRNHIGFADSGMVPTKFDDTLVSQCQGFVSF